MRLIALILARLRRQPGPGRLIDQLASPSAHAAEIARLMFHDESGMLVLDRDGLVVRINDALRRMVSRRVDLSPGADAAAIFRADGRERISLDLKSMLSAERGAFKSTTRLDCADSDPDHMVELSAVAVREADGQVSGLLLRLTDITAQRRLEAQLAHSQKLQATGLLAGGLAHDFNNLLTAIVGAAEMVLARGGVDQATCDDISQIRASAERGAATVRQLLAFGRQQTLRPRMVAINAAIQGMADLLRHVLGGQIRVELELEQPGRTVWVDPTQLDQVLMNLSVNARDAMPRGGTLRLRSGHETIYRPTQRGAETIPAGRYVTIDVEDTGEGIPPDVLPRIFDPFFTTKRDRGGSGLGLSMVDGIVRQSEGFLTVDSAPGCGTLFRLYLPRAFSKAHASDLSAETAAESTGSVPPASTPSSERGGTRTVLLVEDDDAVRRLAERALRQRGWEVDAAECGAQALDLLRARLADPALPPLSAVVSDVMMPGLDGPSVVAAVRGECPGLPAILVSGYADRAARDGLGESGITFLEKPYSLGALTSLVEQVALPART